MYTHKLLSLLSLFVVLLVAGHAHLRVGVRAEHRAMPRRGSAALPARRSRVYDTMI